MPVICATCQTENRDAANFCHGCARKLPRFAATGPSLLDAVRPKRLTGSPEPSARQDRAVQPNESRGFWIGLGLLLLATALGFGGWVAHVTRKVPPPPASDAAQAVVAPPAPAASARQQDPQGPEPVPLPSSLAAGESEVGADPPAAPPGSAAPTTAPAPPLHRQPPRVAMPTPRAGLDPRRGCENLNFFSAARCEAAHCDQPAYTRHPRCDAVREDRRRDQARRNPTLGY